MNIVSNTKQSAPPRKTWLFFLIYFFFWMAVNTLDPYLGVFYESRGISGTQIGVITSGFSLAAVVSAIVSGLIEDRIGRPGYAVTIFVAGMVLSTLALFFSRCTALTFPLIFLYGFCYSPVNGIVDTVALDELHNDASKYSQLRTGGTIGAGIGVLLSGMLITEQSFFLVFLAFWILLGLCGTCAWNMPQSKKAIARIPHWQDYARLVQGPRFLSIYGTLAVWGFTESSVLQFLALHVSGCGLPTHYTSWFIAAAMTGELIGFLCVTPLSRRLSSRSLIAAAFLLQFLRVGSLALLGRLPLSPVMLLQFTGGGAYALLYSTLTAQIGESYPEKVRYSAHALKLVAIRGVGMTCGLLTLGFLFDRGCLRIAYIIEASAAGLSMLYFFLYRPIKA